jgi:hypothetical protein
MQSFAQQIIYLGPFSLCQMTDDVFLFDVRGNKIQIFKRLFSRFVSLLTF